jgi:hypothetical protein
MEAEATTWLGFAGVILGAALGYGSSMVQESLRRRHDDEAAVREREREDRRRLQDRRFEAYVAMITEANRVYAAIKHPAEQAVNAAHVRNAYESFVVALSPAFMVAADARSREVAAALARVVRQLAEAVIEDAETDDGEDDRLDSVVTSSSLDGLLRAHRRSVKAAEAVMRAELGITDP